MVVPVTLVKQDVDPAEVGLDADRLGRVDSYFASYVEGGVLPGFLIVVSRGGKIAHVAKHGWRDAENRLPVEDDTVFRIYSMTKPVTSVAAMMLYEEGRFRLTDPVSDYIPEFADLRVFVAGSALAPITRPAGQPMRVWHLLTHTAGLTYGFLQQHPCDAMYRAAGFEWAVPEGFDLEAACAGWAKLPLMFDPGTSWNYSVATDVLGRLVEVWSGTTLDRFFQERILGPLQMSDTAFFAEGDAAERLAVLYTPDPATGRIRPLEQFGRAALRKPKFLSGGGGLVSTAGDYHRFAQMLLGRGEFEGVRLLGSRTVDYMTTNHLPDGRDIASFGHPISEPDEGVGFGLGFSVVLDPARHKTLSSAGEFAWGGAASTNFWVDPAEDLTVVLMTQLLPSTSLPIRPRLTALVQQAIVD
jgi:CubicO group peptidase (beta-lactamase class C family)